MSILDNYRSNSKDCNRILKVITEEDDFIESLVQRMSIPLKDVIAYIKKILYNIDSFKDDNESPCITI